MKRKIEFRTPVMDCIVKIIPEIEKSFEQRKCDFMYNSSNEIEITSSYIIIKN